MSRCLFFGLLLFVAGLLKAQGRLTDQDTQRVFDSLDAKIRELENSYDQLSPKRDARFFSVSRELDMTRFAKQYKELIYDEELEAAGNLIDSKISEAEKRADKFAIDFYKGYKTSHTRLRGEKRTYYQQLLAKEKNFRKEFGNYIAPGDDYSLRRAARMVDLTINYAEDQKLKETLIYLYKYKHYASALLYDLHSHYDLKRLTGSESHFNKVFNALIDNDSLNVIKEAENLVNQCYHYSYAANTKLDTNFFAMQRIVAANAITDWNERQGISAELAMLTDEAVIARLDTLNRKGIYQWHNMILVIGAVEFSSKSDNVRRGEAIIDADKTLKNYLRLKKITKQGSTKATRIGKSYMVPFMSENKKAYFLFDPHEQKYQYMICYSEVINAKTTQEIARFLPPLQFVEEISRQE
ncbi:MAG: hypothetical protein JXB34_13850 [Bacteroidales bacterium]|nr:hypothetical protein [Bacteroidales bacterium]